MISWPKNGQEGGENYHETGNVSSCSLDIARFTPDLDGAIRHTRHCKPRPLLYNRLYDLLVSGKTANYATTSHTFFRR